MYFQTEFSFALDTNQLSNTKVQTDGFYICILPFYAYWNWKKSQSWHLSDK